MGGRRHEDRRPRKDEPPWLHASEGSPSPSSPSASPSASSRPRGTRPPRRVPRRAPPPGGRPRPASPGRSSPAVVATPPSTSAGAAPTNGTATSSDSPNAAARRRRARAPSASAGRWSRVSSRRSRPTTSRPPTSRHARRIWRFAVCSSGYCRRRRPRDADVPTGSWRCRPSHGPGRRRRTARGRRGDAVDGGRRHLARLLRQPVLGLVHR